MRIENAAIPSMNDLVFENRNKEYGAYAIRKAYSNNVHKALLFVLVSLSGAMILTLFFQGDAITMESKKETKVITCLFPFPKLEPQKPIKSLPVRRAHRDIAPIASTRPDPEETKPQQTDATTGTPDGPLTGEEPTTEPGNIETETNTATVAPPVTHVDPVTWAKVMPQFEGGLEGLAKYMQRNLKYPAVARRMSVEGAVFVSFVIDTQGRVIDVKVIKGIMKECDEEAVRVVSNMPPWIAGRQDNTPVMVRMVLPIRFQLNH